MYNSKQTEENKSNNYISIGTNYTNKLANSNSINKDMNHTKRINTNRHIVSSKNLNLFSGNFLNLLLNGLLYFDLFIDK